jgi:hypothetical protein
MDNGLDTDRRLEGRDCWPKARFTVAQVVGLVLPHISAIASGTLVSPVALHSQRLEVVGAFEFALMSQPDEVELRTRAVSSRTRRGIEASQKGG